MILKPQDIVILLKLVVIDEQSSDGGVLNSRNGGHWTYNSLAHDLFMSPAEVHAGVARAVKAGLMNLQQRRPVIKALEEFLIHGVRYAFPPDRGGMTRGLPTSFAGPPLNREFAIVDEPPPVWPNPEGPVRGLAFSPLYKTASQSAHLDPRLYELLVLVDAIRDGRAREMAMAIKELKRRLGI